MRSTLGVCLLPGLLLAAPAGFPEADETLRYRVLVAGVPAGGAVRFEARRVAGTAATWQFEASADFSLPGIPIRDRYRSLAAGFCSGQFEKAFEHGNRRRGETVVFYPERQRAVRVTHGGGFSEVAIPACARDPLTLLYYTRAEMRRKKLPPPQPVVFGSTYRVELKKTGSEKIAIGNREQKADRIAGSFAGPKSQGSFEFWLAQDEARTPLRIRIPLPVASLTLELEP
jgi:hypothetical protein